MYSSQQIIEQTKKWINEVVIGCNFCPFAAKVIRRDSVHYAVAENCTSEQALDAVRKEVLRLDENKNIETSFLIMPDSFQEFGEYLNLVSRAEKWLERNGYNGIYQLASFHPLYRFADSIQDDAANYTNRSVYPMLHLLREESVEKALELYESPENIPQRNISFAREKGLTYMKLLRDSCLIESPGSL